MLTSDERFFLVLVTPLESEGRGRLAGRGNLVVFVVLSRGAQAKVADRFLDDGACMARC